MPDLIRKCKNTHEKEQLWKKIVSGTHSKVLLIKYSMSAGYPWIFFFFFNQQHGAVDMEIIGGPWAQASKEIKSWLNQIMS